jgi:hypothetical protein
VRIFPIRTVGEFQVSRFGVDPVRAMRASKKMELEYGVRSTV